MKALRFWFAAITISCLTACNYTEGQCWLQDDEGGGVGAGGGPIVPYGSGGYGDAPPKEPQDLTDPPPECNSIGSYSASLFKFTTTVADDGMGKGGGWQEAIAAIKFVDGRQDPPAAWSCTVTVGMAVRSATSGKISPERAAEVTAEVLTDVASPTMHSRTSWLKALFCSALQQNMLTLFKNQYGGLGATVTAQ